MIDIDKKDNVVYVIAEETLNEQNYAKMLPLLRTKVELYGKTRWYFQMKNFKGWTPKALWEDIKFDIRNAENLEKIAMVGEKKWQEIMTQIMKPFTSAEIKYFDEADEGEARSWIKK